MAGPAGSGPAEGPAPVASAVASEPGDRGVGRGTAPLDPDDPSKKNATVEGTSGRDVEYEFAVNELESMRIPGTSDYATIQTYNTLKRMGLRSVDVQRETMKRALSAMMAGDGTEVPLSMRTTTRTGFNPQTKATTGKDKAEPPRALLYSPPVNALKRAAGVRRQVAARVEKLAKDPDELSALEKRLRAASLKSADANAKRTGVDHIGAHVASLTKHRKETRLAAAAARAEAREERAREVKERAAASRLEKEHRTAANLLRKETKKEREAQEARIRAEADAMAKAEAEREAMRVRDAVRTRWRRARRLALASRPPPERAAALRMEEARDGAARVIQRWWRGCVSRVAVRERIRAALFIRDRLWMWYHRRRRREAAENIRAFLEDVGKGNEIVRRLHQLRRACATIQTAYRSAFRVMPDQVDSFVVHWTLYERYLHTSRAVAAEQKKGKGEGADFVRRRRACAQGFRMENVRSYDEVDARQLVPADIKARLVKKFLKQRRRQRGKDWTAYKDALDSWRKNSLRETKLEMARSVMRGNEVRMDDLEREIASKKPVMVRRRVLMNVDELARIHAEGEKEFRNEVKFQEEAIADLFRLSLKKRS